MNFRQRYHLLLTLLTLLPALSSVASAQTVLSPNGPCDGAVLNRRVLIPSQPAYPQKARRAKAEGNVIIRVHVNEEGRVYEASACVGHRLLRRAAEDAAYRTRLSPTLLSGQPLKVTGVLVYGFKLDEGRAFLYPASPPGRALENR